MSTIVHVGLPKCGSTFLQKRFYPNLPNFKSIYTGKELPKAFKFIYSLNKGFDRVQKCPAQRPMGNLGFNSKKVMRWQRQTNDYLALSQKNVVISSEGLCGVSYAPLINNAEIARLIKFLFSDAKIIFLFRKHSDYLESLYRQLVFKENRFGCYLPFDSFFSYSPSLESLASPNDLWWSHCLRNYRDTFGKKNVLSLPYELMKNDLPGFVDVLKKFIGDDAILDPSFWEASENKSEQVSRRTFRNLFGKSKLQEFRGLDNEEKYKIDELFVDDCIQLEADLGMNLEEYGYKIKV